MFPYLLSDFVIIIDFCIDCSGCCSVLQLGILGSSLHHHAGLCLESEKSLCSNEFLWFLHFSSTISAMGTAGFLTVAG